MTTWDNIEKSGTGNGGWEFNEPNLTFNQSIDPDSGNTVYFNGLGLSTTWTNISKS
jgi:hypothetical protein